MQETITSGLHKYNIVRQVRRLALPLTSADAYVCIHGGVSSWMRSNRVQLNTAKIKFLWSTTGRRLHQLPQSPLWVGFDHISPASAVRDLRMYIDSDVWTRSHVTKTVSTCYSVLRQLRTIRRSVSRSVLQSMMSLMSSLVLLRLDYSNSTLAGVSSHLLSLLHYIT